MFYHIRWRGGDIDEYYCSFECAIHDTDDTDAIEPVNIDSTPATQWDAYCSCGKLLWKGRRLMVILRDNTRTEHDDFMLNVAPYMTDDDEAIPVCDISGTLLGWKIAPKYE